MDTYKTIINDMTTQFTEKHSRFIGYVAHTETDEEAVDFIDKIRSQHGDARHNCYAYLLNAEGRTRYSDDGEPHGTAGKPILAIESIEDYIPVPVKNKGKNMFALSVKGDSMINAGILNGDIVIVEQTPVAQNGEIVVALIGDEATVKRFYKENGHFRLQPENDSYEPIIVDEVAILGKVNMVIRAY